MISTADTHLLFIEPGLASAQPVIDELTRKMTGAWRTRRIVMSYRGFHRCACGAESDHHNYAVATIGGQLLTTNLLAIHYLAFHRADVPRAELEKVKQLAGEPADPSPKLLRGMSHRRPDDTEPGA
jgi:hypothetical protein